MGLFDLARPALFTLPPEAAHTLSIKALKSGALPNATVEQDSRLNTHVGGLEFPNPVGLAAGYDKNAEVPDAILRLGFGFTEVGTVTPLAQPGNPRPRIFRIVKDRAVINRLGFNNEGHAAALARLKSRKGQPGIVGVNIGANKTSEDFVADYVKGIETFYSLASYFTANISSPNTPGLRNLQAGEALEVLLARIFAQVEKSAQEHGRRVPVFLKVAPDLDEAQINEIANIVLGSKLSALIISNTTLDRSRLADQRLAAEAGGLSGKPLFAPSTRILASFYKQIGGKVPLVGVGGIGGAADAIAKLEAGASLIQLYTGLIYAGPCLPGQIVNGLSKHLDRTGIESIGKLTGSKVDDWLDG